MGDSEANANSAEAAAFASMGDRAAIAGTVVIVKFVNMEGSAVFV
jgi:hypothetical protein